MRIVKFIALCGMLFLFSLCYLHLVGAADMPDSIGGGLSDISQYGKRGLTPTSNNIDGLYVNKLTTTDVYVRNTLTVVPAGGGAAENITYNPTTGLWEFGAGIDITGNTGYTSAATFSRDSVNAITETASNTIQFVGKTPAVNQGITPTFSYVMGTNFLPPQNSATGFPAHLVSGFIDMVIKPLPVATASPDMNAITLTYNTAGNLHKYTQRITATENIEILDHVSGFPLRWDGATDATQTYRLNITEITRTYNRDPMVESAIFPVANQTLTFCHLNGYWGHTATTAQILLANFNDPAATTSGVALASSVYNSGWTEQQILTSAGGTRVAKIKRTAAGRNYLEYIVTAVTPAGANNEMGRINYTEHTFSDPNYVDISFTLDAGFGTTSNAATAIYFGFGSSKTGNLGTTDKAIYATVQAATPKVIYVIEQIAGDILSDSYTYTGSDTSILTTSRRYRIVVNGTSIKLYINNSEIASVIASASVADFGSVIPFVAIKVQKSEAGKAVTLNVDNLTCGSKHE